MREVSINYSIINNFSKIFMKTSGVFGGGAIGAIPPLRIFRPRQFLYK
jgi:hypothetical protein